MLVERSALIRLEEKLGERLQVLTKVEPEELEVLEYTLDLTSSSGKKKMLVMNEI